MKNVRTIQGCSPTATRFDEYFPSSQGSKRRKLGSNIPTVLAVGDSDKQGKDGHEAEAGELSPSDSLDAGLQWTASSPKRFFMKDGYDECLKTALHCSLRNAELDKWRRLSVMEEAIAQPSETKDSLPSSLSSSPCVKTHSHAPPPPDESVSPQASQESYGGDWVDGVADKLLAGDLPSDVIAAEHKSI
ncbi:hypothetical protein FNYG_15765 [Fusarium nygamai]|uniref:Uncharacterized protein n=1 Tax=Gibberella nygamai TaxID=42673 RepID=A0A2K0U636_GIBNY|nr:hypothetical protein FNYG_15765 [Fusarium nygamai]